MLEIVEVDSCDNPLIKQFTQRCRELDGRGHPLLSELRPAMYFGARGWLVMLDGEPVHVHVTKLGKRKKNKWEPYANWQIAYTRLDHRRKGYAKLANAHMRHEAIEFGCVRLKSLAGTFLGLRMHLSFGDQCWGHTERNEVIVDTPLVDKDWSGVPPNALPGHLKPMRMMHLMRITALRYDT